LKTTPPAHNSEPRLLVVVPTLNERESLPKLLPRLFQALPTTEVLIVDDASPDGTGTWVEAERKNNTKLHLLRRTGPKGLGRAYVEGFTWALAKGYDQIAQMDADGSHDPSSLPALVAGLEKADVVVGSRYSPGGALVNWPWYRQTLSRGAGIYVRLVTGMPAADPTSGFRCFSAAALSQLNPITLRSEGYAFQVEVIHRAYAQRLRVIELPIVFSEREHGRSKLSSLTIGEAIWVALRLGRVRGSK
jgi:dolichol-phosphate mannosyltransferase